MRRLLLILGIAVLSLAAGSRAPAQSSTEDGQVIPRPEWSIGDWWEFSGPSDAWRLTVIARSGDHYVLARSRTGAAVQDGIARTTHHADLDGWITKTIARDGKITNSGDKHEWVKFPLRVGNRWFFSAWSTRAGTTQRFVYDHDCRVESWDTIDIGERSIRALNIATLNRARGDAGSGSVTAWYAPEAKRLVRLMPHYAGGPTLNVTAFSVRSTPAPVVASPLSQPRPPSNEPEQQRLADEARRRAEEQRAAEERRKQADEHRLAEEQRKRAEAQRLAEETQRDEDKQRVADEQRKRAEEQRLAEEQRKREETQRLTEEARRREEQQRLADEQRKRTEEQRLAEEQRKREEAQRLAEEARRREEQQRLADEQRKRAEEQRLANEQRKREAVVRADTQAPVISLNYPPADAKTDRDQMVVVGLVTDDTAVTRIQVSVNGTEVERVADVKAGSRGVPLRATVKLEPGLNVIEVTAADAAGNVAQIVRTVSRVVSARLPVTGNRLAVVIGVGNYEHTAIPKVRYAVQDAEAIYQVLVGPGGFKKENVLLLTDRTTQRPTLRNIKSALGTFLARSARKDDTVLIFFAGHGAPEIDTRGLERDGLAKYLIPSDADPNDLYATALSMDEIHTVFGRIEAERMIMFVDACYSGAVGGRTFASKRLRTRDMALDDQFLDRLTRAKGRAIVTASRPSELSVELPELGHGLFTYYLVEGLRGAADLNRDGIVTLQELYEYVEAQVSRKSRAVGGNQHPVMKGELEGPLPLVLVGPP